MEAPISISIISAVIAAIAALFALFQARVARDAIKQTSLLGLFESFNRASDATLQNPDLLYEVHGLPKTIDEPEAKRIAYLSLLLDGFQHYYGHVYKEDFKAMERDLKKHSVFLNRILGIESNQRPWNVLKNIYYGDFDSEFIKAVDRLFEYELSRK